MTPMHETTETKRSATAEQTRPAEAPVYEPPRIVTHSAEELKRRTLKVDACVSFSV